MKRLVKSSVNLLYPWKMIARFEDGYETEVSGMDEDDCIYIGLIS